MQRLPVAHRAFRSRSICRAPTPVRQEAVATSSTFTQSGDGKGLATAPMAPTSQSAVTSQVKERQLGDAEGMHCEDRHEGQRDEKRDDEERDEGRGAEAKR